MRVALCGRIIACVALLTWSALASLQHSACANEPTTRPDAPVCPPTAYLGGATQVQSDCPSCEEQADSAPPRPGLFGRWRFRLRNRDGATGTASERAPRESAALNAACTADARACSEACERTVNFEAPLEQAAACPACECETAVCAACVRAWAECSTLPCQTAECAECAACAGSTDHCAVCASHDSPCAVCTCPARQCADCACADAAHAACVCPEAAYAAGTCAAAGCAACDASCSACAEACSCACCEPAAEAAPVVLGEPSAEEMAAEILELRQRLGPGALDGTVFESPEGEALDPAAADAARAAMRSEMESYLRWLAEQRLARQVAPADEDQIGYLPAAPAEEIGAVATLQSACRSLEETAHRLEEQGLFAAADQVREVAAQLRQTARSLAGQAAPQSPASRGTSVRSARRPAESGRATGERRRSLLQTPRLPNLR